MRSCHSIIVTAIVVLMSIPPSTGQGQGKNSLLVDDMKSISKWRGENIEHGTERGGTLKWTLSPGKAVEFCTIDLKPFAMDPTKYDRLKFEYKVDGPCKWFGVKIVHPALFEGKQAVYIVHDVGDGTHGWRRASFAVSEPEVIWEPKPKGTNLCLRATCGKDGPCVIQVKNLRFARCVVKTDIRPITVPDGETDYEIILKNVDTEPHEVDLALDASGLKAFSGSISAQHVQIQPEGTATVPVRMALLPNQKRPPLYAETAWVTVRVRKEPGSVEKLCLSPAVPLPKLSRPFVLTTKEQIEKVKAKVKKCQWAKKIYDGGLIGKADWLLKTPIKIPDRTGTWWHYYYCKECGCVLKTVTPTQHKCTGCGKVYSGDPYDAVAITSQHYRWAGNARCLGLAFAFTGNIEYAKRSAEIFKEYAEKYQKYIPQDHLGNIGRGWRVISTRLEQSGWAIPMAQAYDFIRDAGVLMEEEKKRIEGDFLWPVAKSVQGHRGIGNITCWRNAAVGSIGLAIGAPELVRWAIEEPAGLKDQIAKGILEDGFWFEGSWGYHFYALDPLCYLAESASHVGINVFDKRFEKMFTAPIKTMSTDRRLPAFNDSGGTRVQASWCYGVAAMHYPGNKVIAWLVSQRLATNKIKDINSLLYFPTETTAAAEPPMRTCLLEASGIVILRSLSAIDQLYVAFDYGPHGGGHGHPDKLGFVLRAFGMDLALDPGIIGSYALPLHRQWYCQTIAHNTLTVDQKSQKPTTGELLYLESSPQFQIASARTTGAYPGVDFVRTMAIIANDCVLVFDDVKSDKEHLYDIAYHIRGELKTNLDLQPPSASAGQANGYEVLEDVKMGKGKELVTADFNIKSEQPIGVRMLTLGADGGEVITALGRGNPPTERIPCIILRKKARETRYISILEPFRQRAKIKNISSHPVVGHDGAVDKQAVGITIESENWRAAGIIASTKAKRSCQANKLQTDAKAALVLWENREIKGALVVEGQSVTVDGKTIPSTSF